MSLYILPENQKLIWGNLSTIPSFHTLDQNNTIKKEDWFREIIYNFYESNKFKLLSVQELQQLNRDTLFYMIKNLKELETAIIHSQPVPSSLSFGNNYQSFTGGDNDDINQNSSHSAHSASRGVKPIPFASSPPQNNNFPSNTIGANRNHVGERSALSTEFERKAVTRDFIMEQKQEELNKQFSNRQKDYGEMLKRGPQHNIDFRELEADKPIDNMEALIKQHMEQRDFESKSYAVPPTTYPNSSDKSVVTTNTVVQSVQSLSDVGELIGVAATTPLHTTPINDTAENFIISEPSGSLSKEFDYSQETKKMIRSSKFPYLDITNEPPSKNVRWSEDVADLNPKTYTSVSDFNSINEFREFMTDIKNDIKSMRQEIEQLKRERSPSTSVTNLERYGTTEKQAVRNNTFGSIQSLKPGLHEHHKNNINFDIIDITNSFN